MFTLIMLISHTISDFIIQTDKIAAGKKDFKIKAYLYHGLGLLITSIIPFIFYELAEIPVLAGMTLLIILLHLIIDYIRARIEKARCAVKKPQAVRMIIYFADQIIHILVILIITRGIRIEFNNINYLLSDALWVNAGLSYTGLRFIFIVLYAAFSGAYAIPLMFDLIYRKVDNYSVRLNRILKNGNDKNGNGKNCNDNNEVDVFIDEVRTGKWIGIFERIILSILLFAGQLASIGFVIAAKSIARFKMMDNKIFSEYFLLGTFMSVIYAIGFFMLFNLVL